MPFIPAIILLLFLLVVTVTVPLVFLLQLIGWTWTSVPYVPVSGAVQRKIRELMPLTDSAVVYDLGCGDGRVLYMLAKNSNARFIGVEKAPLPFLMAKLRGLFAGRPNVRIIYGDIYKTPLTDATHVFTYLLTPVMKNIAPKFNREFASGTVLVSCDFVLPDREAETVLPVPGAFSHTLYKYRF